MQVENGGGLEEGRQDGLGVSGEEREERVAGPTATWSQADADACIQGPRVSSGLEEVSVVSSCVGSKEWSR